MPIGRKKKSPSLGSQSITAGSYRPTRSRSELVDFPRIRSVQRLSSAEQISEHPTLNSGGLSSERGLS